jgi:hypothetical protein
MARREFTRDVYAQIVKRATTASGHVACEGCGLVLGKRPYHVDHTKPDAMEVDKRRKLTAADGKLLGVECCHKPKTAQDVKVIAKAKRVEAKHLGTKAPPRVPIKSASFTPAEPQRRASRPIDKLAQLPKPQLFR